MTRFALPEHPGSHLPRNGTKQAAEAQNPATEPEFGATEPSQIGAEAELVELRAWRDALLQPTQTAGAIFNMQKPRGQASAGASDPAGRPQRFDGVSARGLPARHYACPTHADLPQPLPGRLWSRRSSIKSDLGVHDRPR